MKSKGCDIPDIKISSRGCDCNYVPPAVKKLLFRRNKKGQLQVKVNGIGKWIDAELDLTTNTIRYTA